MKNYKAYQTWAPDDALWTQWAKPVLFSRPPYSNRSPLTIPAAKWAPYPDGKTALIVDLPKENGVLEGLALAEIGYRPIPLYNGVFGFNTHSMAVHVSSIVSALYRGADKLASLSIRLDAPPVFLLDSERMKGAALQKGTYDNRWCVFAQDMPSASFLLEHGIQQIYVRTDQIQNDLTHILRRYQEKGIGIYHVEKSGNPTELTVVRPSQFRSLLYRVQAMMGLTRNAAGGFGGKIPEATQSSGTRYYGMG